MSDENTAQFTIRTFSSDEQVVINDTFAKNKPELKGDQIPNFYIEIDDGDYKGQKFLVYNFIYVGDGALQFDTDILDSVAETSVIEDGLRGVISGIVSNIIQFMVESRLKDEENVVVN